MNTQKLAQGTAQALEIYRSHTMNNYLSLIKPHIAGEALADRAWASKRYLRQMLSKHPDWDDELQAVVLGGTKIVRPDYAKVYESASSLLGAGMSAADVYRLASWVTWGQNSEYISEHYSEAYNPDAKRNRVFRKILISLGLWDDTHGSKCQRKYAFISDSLSARKTDFKLVVSIHPGAFLTMSNPKSDPRGEMLTSCHSLDNNGFEYSNGCSGYASDEISMIAFTAKSLNPDDLYSRKTARQLFMYEPGSGILLQSRMYDSEGGTRGRTETGDLWRQMVQGMISECEDRVNLWAMRPYHRQKDWSVHFDTGEGFGGYPDWYYDDFSPMLSVAQSLNANFHYDFTVGAAGTCLRCGNTLSGESGIYCEDCNFVREYGL